MSNVPNTSTFTFQDVSTAVHNDTAAGRSLSGAFSAATGIFDAGYQGSKNQLDDFRNYQNVTAGKYILITDQTAGLVYLSTDRGVTFNSIGLSGAWTGAAMSGSGEYQYVTSSNNGTYRSTNYGATWSSSNTTVGYGIACSLDGGYVFCSTDYYVLRSSNYGASWGYMPVNGYVGRNEKITCNHGGLTVYVTNNATNSLWRSTNNGVNYTNLNSIAFLRVACDDTGYYVYTCTGSTLYRSSDNGNTFPAKVTFFFSDVAMSKTGTYVLAGGSGYYHYSNNSGSTFTMSSFGAGTAGIAMSNDGTVIAIAQAGNGIPKLLLSINSGTSYTEYFTNSDTTYPNEIAINRGI